MLLQRAMQDTPEMNVGAGIQSQIQSGAATESLWLGQTDVALRAKFPNQFERFS
jgi:hypothetical protein